MPTACPSEEAITCYLERVAGSPGDERDTISEHLETCGSCRLTFAMLAPEVVGEAPLPEGLVSVGDRLGPYRIDGLLGSGGMGEVFLATDERLGRLVAIKQVRRKLKSTQSSRLMLEEARGLARLSHPNIVGLFDIQERDGIVWLAMEFVDGMTLGEWQQQPHTLAEKLSLFHQVGEGLAAAHQSGVVHRDVKPANILVGRDGRVRVSDFGLATIDGVMLGHGGTPAYMAPEQRRGRPTSAAADQYSLCVMMTEVLTGERPPGAIEWPSNVPASVRSAVTRGLSADPNDRFESMRDFLSALAPEKPSNTRWFVLAASLAILGLFVFARGAAPTRAEIVRQLMPSVVLVVAENDTQLHLATGVLLHRGTRGYVLTADGVVGGAEKLGVLTRRPDLRLYAPEEGGANRFLFEHKGELIGARLVRVDASRHLALLDLPGDFSAWPDLQPDSSALTEGETVMAVGHPSGALWSVTEGLIAAVRTESIQTNFVGGAGSPLFDSLGRWVGFLTVEGSSGVSAATAVGLLDGVHMPFTADQSTPAATVVSCRRAFELGDVDAWVACSDTRHDARAHREVTEFMFAHASSKEEAVRIRYFLTRAAPDYMTSEHARREAREYARQVFSHDVPQLRAGSLIANVLAAFPSLPSDALENVRMGARIEQVVQVDDSLAWVLLESPKGRSSLVTVKCERGWCFQEIPYPEQRATLPPGFPEPKSWHEMVERNGLGTLAMWRSLMADDDWWPSYLVR